MSREALRDQVQSLNGCSIVALFCSISVLRHVCNLRRLAIAQDLLICKVTKLSESFALRHPVLGFAFSAGPHEHECRVSCRDLPVLHAQAAELPGS